MHPRWFRLYGRSTSSSGGRKGMCFGMERGSVQGGFEFSPPHTHNVGNVPRIHRRMRFMEQQRMEMKTMEDAHDSNAEGSKSFVQEEEEEDTFYSVDEILEEYFDVEMETEDEVESVPSYQRIPSVEGTDEVLREKKEGSMVLLSSGIASDVIDMLYDHQKEGIEWLLGLQQGGQGGILGDDMGLGKTMQVSAFVSGMMNKDKTSRFLVIAPKTLLVHWEKELGVCHLSNKTKQYVQGMTGESNVRHVRENGGVLLTTYGMVLHNASILSGQGFSSKRDPRKVPTQWDYVILDEGHKIKNPAMQLAKAIRTISTRHRIIISGTPIQNNLQELWALFDFTNPGLLGSLRSFKEIFEKPILRGNDRDALPFERSAGAKKAAELRSVIAPFFLRREKKDVFREKGSIPSRDEPVGSERTGQCELEQIGKKSDMIVWLKMSAPQRKLYTAFLEGNQVQTVLNESGSALVALNTLKKICDHPSLLSKRATMDIKSTHLENRGEWEALLSGTGTGLSHRMDSGIEEVISDSCKTSFLMQLLDELIAEGHRTLVFSRSKRMLDIVEHAIGLSGHRFCRVDGDVSSSSERQARVDEFQGNESIPVFLLTSGVGGLGLTLTAADRVVILDPSWNPATDNQSVDRAYRIGQEKHVVIYRLITCGTVEEKQYRRQIFKEGLSRTGTKEGEQMRYFSKNELKEFFSVSHEKLDFSETDCQIIPLHGGEQAAMKNLHLSGLEDHISRLKQFGAAAVSDHSLLFSRAPVQEETPTFAVHKRTPKKGPQVANWQGNSHIVAAGSSLKTFLRKADTEPTPRFADCKAAEARAPTAKAKGALVTDTPGEKSQDINLKIQRLTRLLKDSAVVNRLPDRGASLRKALHDLEGTKEPHLQQQERKKSNVGDVVDVAQMLDGLKLV